MRDEWGPEAPRSPSETCSEQGALVVFGTTRRTPSCGRPRREPAVPCGAGQTRGLASPGPSPQVTRGFGLKCLSPRVRQFWKPFPSRRRASASDPHRPRPCVSLPSKLPSTPSGRAACRRASGGPPTELGHGPEREAGTGVRCSNPFSCPCTERQTHGRSRSLRCSPSWVRGELAGSGPRCAPRPLSSRACVSPAAVHPRPPFPPAEQRQAAREDSCPRDRNGRRVVGRLRVGRPPSAFLAHPSAPSAPPDSRSPERVRLPARTLVPLP